MKKYLLFFLLFIISSFHVYSAENNIKLIPEPFTDEKFRKLEIFPGITEFDPGSFKTFIFVENLSKDKKYIMKVKREKIGVNDFRKVQEFSGDKLYPDEEKSIFPLPFLHLSGKYFLPGEEIALSFESEDGEQHDVINFYPNPVEWKSKKDKAMVHVDLVCLSPAMYRICFKNFKKNEKLVFISLSCGERLETPIVVENNTIVTHMPGVVGKDGGINECGFMRSNKEQIIFTLPWGNEFIEHLKGNRS